MTFLYDNMIKGELQTEDGFLIVSIKQEPLLTDVKTEPEEDDTYNSTSYQQNVKTEIETEEQPKEAPEVHHSRQETNFKCDICDKNFAIKGNLKRHIRIVHDKIRAFPCPHCPYKAGYSSTLKDHILMHTGETNFKCDICDKKFTQKYNLKQHIRTVHDKIRAFPCPHCQYKATTGGHLKHHILMHTGENNFNCDICDKKFTQKGNLKQHIRIVHDKIRAFPCPHCPYKAGHSNTLKDHILMHTGEKNFSCDTCDKKFTTNSVLKLHITTVHDKIRAFPCPQCSYKASTSGNLKDHIHAHTGKKNSKCDNCDKKFTTSSVLKQHIRTVHDKIKAFPCPYCLYKATKSDGLKRHILTHMREKNFTCDICDNKFTTSSQLKLHIRTVHV